MALITSRVISTTVLTMPAGLNSKPARASFIASAASSPWSTSLACGMPSTRTSPLSQDCMVSTRVAGGVGVSEGFRRVWRR